MDKLNNKLDTAGIKISGQTKNRSKDIIRMQLENTEMGNMKEKIRSKRQSKNVCRV